MHDMIPLACQNTIPLEIYVGRGMKRARECRGR